MGGPSSERSVSLETGEGVLKGLLDAGINAYPIVWDVGDNIAQKLAGAGAVWIALHGTCGEDGAIQGLLTCLNIPYTGANIESSAIAMNKVTSKVLFEHFAIPSPAWCRPALGESLVFPSDGLVVKPSAEGSSVGVSIVRNEAELAGVIEATKQFQGEPIVEHYIPGTEIFVGILDNKIIGSVQVKPATEFYDYEAKYQRNDTEYLCPPSLDKAIVERASKHALRACQVMGIHSYSRVDIRIDEDGLPYVLEVNTLPGMTASSLMPKIAKHAGISYSQLCSRILELAQTPT